MKNKKARVLFLSHGAGPMPLLRDEGHQAMVENLKVIETKIEKPSAIIVISAHWEAKIPTITSGVNPSLPLVNKCEQSHALGHLKTQFVTLSALYCFLKIISLSA